VSSSLKAAVSTLALGAGIAGIAGAAQAAEILVTTDIAVSTTWTASNTYNLQTQIYVLPGATLTIEPGTVIASDTGVGGSLAVTRGAKIFALGTQEKPIIFTSKADVATWVGGDPKTGAWREAVNEWGNLTLMGAAYVSENAVVGNVPTPNAANVAPMEGLVAGFPGDTKVLYGGGDDEDNSGTLRFVSLRYGGKVVALNNELNGLSLGGIGRETDIHHIDIMNNVDDGIEVWGGTVNLKYLNIWNVGDDSLDIDQGWRGKAQFGLIVQGYAANASQGSGVGDNAIETDGAENSDWLPVTTAAIRNFTVIGQPIDGDHGTAWRDNARVQYRNCIFMDLGEKLVQLDNVDGDGGAGYGFNGTLSWAATWTTPATFSALNQAQVDGNLAEIKDSVFYRNQFATAYTEATTVGVFNAGNNNVNAGAALIDQPIVSITRGPLVLKGGKNMLPVIGLDPRPAAAAVTSVGSVPADGFYTPAAYRGAFAPGQSWLGNWTASFAYGYTPAQDSWTTLGFSLPASTGHATLQGTGPLTSGSLDYLTLTNAKAGVNALLLVSLSNTPVPFKGGTLITVPILTSVTLPTGATGSLALPFLWPAGIPAGLSFYFQYAIPDATAVKGVALSNALKGTAQ
jgi:hypothetical protein